MAALIKLHNMPIIRRAVFSQLIKSNRALTTSKKSATSAATADCKTEDKNWVSYGFDYTSKDEDTNAHHSTYFFSISLCVVFGSFLWAYAPDVHMRDWAQREAYLELHRREKAGYKPIDPNYVNPRCVKLPSEKELCDVEIII